MEIGKCVICHGTDGYREDDKLCENCRGMFCECGGLILSNGCCAMCGKETATIEDEIERLNRRLRRENGVDDTVMIRVSVSDDEFLRLLRTCIDDCMSYRLTLVLRAGLPAKLPKGRKSQ